MKAIILSAGQGSRLKPVTNDRPKGMVEVAGRPIIERQLEAFRRAGIDDVIVVDGFCAEAIPDYGIKRYTNPDYATTNMVHSLMCAEPELGESSVIVSYGDILYSESVLHALLQATGPVSVVVDLAWESYWRQRFEDPYDDAESLILDPAGLITHLGQGDPRHDEVQGQYIGLMKFEEDGLREILRLRADVEASEKPIGWGRAWRSAYMTDLLQELVARGIPVGSVPIHGRWCEIDSFSDLEIAEERVKLF